MKITLNTPYENITELFQNFGKTIDLSLKEHNEDKQIILSKEYGSGEVWFREVTNGMGIVLVNDLILKEQFEIKYKHNESIPAFELMFIKNLRGEINLSTKSNNLNISVKNGAFLISTAIQETHMLLPNRPTNLVSIFIFPEFIEKYLKSHSQLFESKENKGVFNKLLYHIEMLSSDMMLILNSLENHDFIGDLKNLYLESKVLELIALFFQELDKRKSKEIDLQINSTLKNLILKAKTHLDNNVDNPPSVTELARIVGSNEYNLRLGFKKILKQTVYGYIREQRMIEAKRLIENKNLSVSEAGFMVGYSNMSHFTKAFKKQFGIAPSQLKK